MNETEKIIEKIQNLLSLAEDGGNDEESQTALLLAQKLMLKYKISQQEIATGDEANIVTRSLSIYKKLFWWEKLLASVIADNFRVMLYVQTNKLPYQSTRLRKQVFMGLEEDVILALQMYHFAETALKHHAKQHLEKMKGNDINTQAEIRKAYYRGFIDGLKGRFEAQREVMKTESPQYELLIKIPSEVEAAFYQTVSHRKIRLEIPDIHKTNGAYQAGYKKGQTLNLTKHQLETQ